MALTRPPYPGTVSKPRYVYQYPSYVKTPYGIGRASIRNGTYSSVKTPNFKNLKRHQLPMNPFSISSDTYTWTPGRYGAYNGEGGAWSGFEGQIEGTIAHVNIAPDLSWALSDADTKALTKLLDKLKDSSVNLGQAFAERKQTVNTITKSINRLASAAFAIRNGKFRHAQSLFGQKVPNGQKLWQHDLKPSPNNLANHWLEFQYGWRPLLKDIHGSAELIAKSYFERHSSEVKSQAEFEVKRFGKQTYYVQTGPYRIYHVSNEFLREIVRYNVEFRESSAIAAKLASTGITNPLLLGWELLPYSFVVDWFLPVGNYLSSLDATVGLEFHRGTKTVRRWNTRDSYYDNSKVVKGGTDWAIITGNQSSYLGESKVRTVLNAFPRPSPPQFNRNPFGVERALSAIALLTQAFKR